MYNNKIIIDLLKKQLKSYLHCSQLLNSLLQTLILGL